MNVVVEIDYRTAWGESMRLVTADGAMHEMQCSASCVWQAIFTVEGCITLDYRAEIVCNGEIIRQESSLSRKIVLDESVRDVHIVDYWHDTSELSPLYKPFFSEITSKRIIEESSPLTNGIVRFEVLAPAIGKDERVAIVGASQLLGEWSEPRRMHYVGESRWQFDIVYDELTEDFEYKFIIIDHSQRIVRWEEGENRKFLRNIAIQTHVVACGEIRDREINCRKAGVAVPVFSLRTNESFGTGEFADLVTLGRWCQRCGLHVIQILPINDTTLSHTWRDSYPYNANSVFALHPLYVRLSDVGKIADREKLIQFERLREQLNTLPQVDYEGVMRAKMEYLHLLYDESGYRDLNNEKCREFIERNHHWLTPYAVYSVLRDRHDSADFSQWGDYAKYSDKLCDTFARENSHDVGFYYFVQYHLDSQLRQATMQLHEMGIALKGDIPIGVSPLNSDVWQSPNLFDTTSSAGAPPDDFSETGQNWGFPTYNWARMAEDGYAWWRARLAKMSEYFDAFRIDHILGFFRIWEVPRTAVNALLGEFNPSLPYSAEEIVAAGIDFNEERDVSDDYLSDDVLWLRYRHAEGFYPRITPFDTKRFLSLGQAEQAAFHRLHDEFYYHRNDSLWQQTARKRLDGIIADNDMLVCGEDLGMIPSCVPVVMHERRILSLEIERMPKTLGTEYADVLHYPTLSVCTTSTHDMSTIRQWWKESNRQEYYNNVLGFNGSAPQEMTTDVCEAVVRRHLQSPAILTILPIQDLLSIDTSVRAEDNCMERINVPADPNHYWRYRMHIAIEELIDAAEFNQKLSNAVAESGR